MDTVPRPSKFCKRCCYSKPLDQFDRGRNVCKQCRCERNAARRIITRMEQIPLRMDDSALARFQSRYVVDQTTGCWLWQGWLDRDGYGRFGWRNRQWLPHRLSYQHYIGPIAEKLHAEHRCRVRRCVNPVHIEPITSRENSIRGVGPMMSRLRAAQRTHCRNGHPFDTENTYRRTDNGGKRCRLCKRQQQARRR